MHGNVSNCIAFSGEFFIRRLEGPTRPLEEQQTHPPSKISGGPPDEAAPADPVFYELTTDSDSGTYRPNKDLLFQLQAFMERNLPGLRIKTLDYQDDAEKMERMKEEQRQLRKEEGKPIDQRQDDEPARSETRGDENGNEQVGVVHIVGSAIGGSVKTAVSWAKGDGQRKTMLGLVVGK